MRKNTMGLLSLCLALCLLLTGCARVPTPLATATLVPGTNPVLPQAEAPEDLRSNQLAVLYYRFGSEPYLAPETTTLSLNPAEPYEMALLTALLAGPGTQSGELTALFPTGTRVLDTELDARTLFVTLSGEIYNSYPDEPAQWQNSPSWQQEVPLRRQLCMQSLVATVTENCDVDQVVVLVDGEDDEPATRLTMAYYPNAAETGVALPLQRQETMLLTPGNTLSILMTLWQQQDWPRMYTYLCRNHPTTGESLRSYQDFVTVMIQRPRPLSFAISGGSVSPDGQTYTATVNLQWQRQPGVEENPTAVVLRLYRESGLWRMPLELLLSLPL